MPQDRRNTLRWVAPTGGATVATDPRPAVQPARLSLRSQETIYILSKEGAGSAGPAHHSPDGGRSRRRWRNGPSAAAAACPNLRCSPSMSWPTSSAGQALPDQFSHYGSKGLIVMGILQSWSQGVELWGEANMRKIWSAANVKVYGGGVAEEGFLRRTLGPDRGLQLHQRLRLLRQIRLQPLPAGGQGTHLRRLQPRRTGPRPRRRPRLRRTGHPGPHHALVHRPAQGRRGGIHQEVQPPPGGTGGRPGRCRAGR